MVDTALRDLGARLAAPPAWAFAPSDLDWAIRLPLGVGYRSGLRWDFARYLETVIEGARSAGDWIRSRLMVLSPRRRSEPGLPKESAAPGQAGAEKDVGSPLLARAANFLANG